MKTIPIIHLAKIGQLYLLHEFFDKVSIPDAVYEECIIHGKEYEEVELIRKAKWLTVHSVGDQKLIRLLESELDKGESEAIVLSLERKSDLLLLDDADARQKAKIYNLKITGTLGILLRAKKENKIQSFKQVLERLVTTGFHINS
jgi:predicted nucleic acid-binding protein